MLLLRRTDGAGQVRLTDPAENMSPSTGASALTPDNVREVMSLDSGSKQPAVSTVKPRLYRIRSCSRHRQKICVDTGAAILLDIERYA